MKKQQFYLGVGNLTEMGKDKLKRFSQLKTFKNVIQPHTNYLSKDDPVKGNSIVAAPPDIHMEVLRILNP